MTLGCLRMVQLRGFLVRLPPGFACFALYFLALLFNLVKEVHVLFVLNNSNSNESPWIKTVNFVSKWFSTVWNCLNVINHA